MRKNGYTIMEVCYENMKSLEEDNSNLRARVEGLERDAQARETDFGYTRARVAELETERNTLVEMINAMNEEDTQLAHRLWCLENPE